MQGHPQMFKETNELINIVERYEREEANIQGDIDDFKFENPDQQSIKKIMRGFVKQHETNPWDSAVLDSLPIVLAGRKVSDWTYWTFELFLYNYDTQVYPNGYLELPLDEEIERITENTVRLQRFAKRFIARKKLLPTKHVPHTEDAHAEMIDSIVDGIIKLQSHVRGFLARIGLAPMCAICMEPIRPRNKNPTPCGHLFHPYCIGQWKQYKSNCPMCRAILQ
jgi:hypothetical protein